MSKKLVIVAVVTIVAIVVGLVIWTQYGTFNVQPLPQPTATPTPTETPNEPEPTSTTIFSDGFETGTTGVWTSTRGTMQVDSNANSGKYAYQFSIEGASQLTSGSYVSKRFEPETTVSAGGYIYIPVLPDMIEGDRVYFVIISSDYAPLAYAGIVQYEDGLKWQVMTRDGEDLVTQGHGTVSAGKYYSVQLAWSEGEGTTGFAKLYIDGSLMGDITGVDTSFFGDANRVTFGISEKTGSAFPFEVTCDDFTLLKSATPG